MRFYVRFGLGLVLGGILAAAVHHYQWGAWWLAPAAGGVAGILVFLLSFFLWTADRAPSEAEPQGYEQVLFDGRNVFHVLLLSVVLAGAAYGVPHYVLDGGSVPQVAAPHPAEAQLAEAYANMTALSQAFQDAYSAFGEGEDAGDLAAAAKDADAKRVEYGSWEVPESLEAKREALVDAATFFAVAYSELAKCVESSTPRCIDARVPQGEAIGVLEAYDN